jgi:hypothetical protein
VIGRLRRGSIVVTAAVTALLCLPARTPAAVDMSVGIRHVSDTGTLSDCSAKAQAALDAFLQGTTEATPGSGDWIAHSQNGVNGTPTSTAVVRCYGLSKGGYVVTFTCAVQLPDNPYTANELCLNVAHKFYGGAITSLAAIPTPTPVPSGCATNSLVGTWVSDDNQKLTFTMDLNGDVTDSDGVSGNWALKGDQVTFTYYGTHTLTLSPDGKRLKGAYNLTRKC